MIIRSLLLLTVIGCLAGCSEPDSDDPVAADSVGESTIVQPQSSQPTLNICATDWMPFAYIMAGEPTGIMVELAQDIAKDLGFETRFHFMAPQRCYSETHQGHMDLSLFMSPLALARQGSQLSAVDTSVQNQMPILVVKQENPLQRFSSLSALTGQSIAGIRGNSFMLKNQESGPKWTPVNHLDSLWQLLMSDRVDAALGDFHSRVMLTPEQQQTVRFVLPPMEIEPIYWAGHQDKQALIDQFSQALGKRLASGEVDRFYQRHLGMYFSDLQRMIDTQHYQFTTSEQETKPPALH